MDLHWVYQFQASWPSHINVCHHNETQIEGSDIFGQEGIQDDLVP